MSWIFGITGSISDETKSKILDIGESPIGVIERNNSLVLFGGIRENIYQNVINNSEYLAVGIPLILKKEKLTKVLPTEIDDRFFKPNDNSIDGHYLVVKLEENEISITNDLLGLRDGYLYESKNYTIFSTRLDYISQMLESSEIDFEQFSTTWLFQNQLSRKSLLKRIKRFGPGSKVKISNGKISLTNSNWQPNFNKALTEDLVLKRIELTSLIESKKNISLGLSGGLDSRFLLSILQNSKRDWQAHTFGNSKNPDVSIAEKIQNREKFEHLILDNIFKDPDEIIKLIKKAISLSGVIAPATEFLQHNYYKILFDQNFWIIDGGFGEVFRRQFLNRAAVKGKSDILNKNCTNLIPHFLHNKADIFHNELSAVFKQGVLSQLEELFDQLPDPNLIGVYNWLDLVAVKTRLPNIYGAGQNSLDAISEATMPFAQLSTINAAFSLTTNHRKNGKFFRKNLNDNLKILPLVKSGTTYPFGLSTMTSWVWTKVKNKMGQHYSDQSSQYYLDTLEEYICDLTESESVKKNGVYDYNKVSNLVNSYFEGEKHLASQLDWWLSFELWNQTLNGK